MKDLTSDSETRIMSHDLYIVVESTSYKLYNRNNNIQNTKLEILTARQHVCLHAHLLGHVNPYISFTVFLTKLF